MRISLSRAMAWSATFAIAFVLGVASDATACGTDTNCELGDRYYRVALPETIDPDRPLGALLFAHGYRGSAQGVMGHDTLRGLADELHVAFIALQAPGDDWMIPGVPSQSAVEGADEMAYIDAVLADATERFGIDPKRRMASGFSAGGMMVWNIACNRGNSFAGFIPVAGTFWEPTPDDCPSPPASIVHIHGEADKIVPLAGRPIQETHQGDMAKVIEMYAQTGGFEAPEPMALDGLQCERRDNADGDMFAVCLHPEGHSLRVDDIRQAWALLAEVNGF